MSDGPVELLWKAFEQELVSEGCSPETRADLRRAFHSGAFDLYAAMEFASGSGHEVFMRSKIEAEYNAHLAEVERAKSNG